MYERATLSPRVIFAPWEISTWCTTMSNFVKIAHQPYSLYHPATLSSRWQMRKVFSALRCGTRLSLLISLQCGERQTLWWVGFSLEWLSIKISQQSDVEGYSSRSTNVLNSVAQCIRGNEERRLVCFMSGRRCTRGRIIYSKCTLFPHSPYSTRPRWARSGGRGLEEGSVLERGNERDRKERRRLPFLEWEKRVVASSRRNRVFHTCVARAG